MSHAQVQDCNAEPPQPTSRPVGGTENSWCRAVPTGTGITVLALLLSKPPDISLLQNALHKLQNYHPILRSKLHFDSSTNTFCFLTPPLPHCQISSFDLSSTSQIIPNHHRHDVSQFHLILEHELNQNAWRNDNTDDTDLFLVTTYALNDGQWAVVFRLHTSVCDRSSAVSLLRETLKLAGGETKGGGIAEEYDRKSEVSLGIEDFIPSGKANKPFWARGLDMLGYSLNSFRLSYIDFLDASSPRRSKVARLRLDSAETQRLIQGCNSRGIKLCGALAAAGLIAARSSKSLSDGQSEKYAVVTLIDCRSILDPVLSSSHLGKPKPWLLHPSATHFLELNLSPSMFKIGSGFYHSATLNTHDINGTETLWELATRAYTSFANAKNNNKHFTDMNDLNFLMCKAIENPGLTPSSSLRTAFISVFEDPVIDESNGLQQEIGLEDYIGCSSVHGVGPSIAIFDTLRDGQLDCACVYPSPLHSEEQMQKLIDEMKVILVDAGNSEI